MSTNEPLTISEAAQALGLPKATLRHILQRPDRRARLLHAYRNTKKGLKTVELVPADLLEELSHSFPPVDGAVPEDPDDTDAISDVVTSDDPNGLSESVDTKELSIADVPAAAADDNEAAADGIAAATVADSEGTVDETTMTLGLDKSTESTVDEDGSTLAQTSLVDASMAGEIKHGAVNQQTGDAMMIVATYERLLAEREARLLELHASLETERANARRIGEALSKAQQALSKAQSSLDNALTRPVPSIDPAQAEIPPTPQTAALPDEPSPPQLPPHRGFWARVFNR